MINREKESRNGRSSRLGQNLSRESRIDRDTQLAVGLPQIQVVAGETSYIDVRDFLREGEDLGTMADADVITRVNELLELDLGLDYKVTRPSTGNILISRNATFG